MEYVVWGLAKGETDRLHEELLAGSCKNKADVEKVKAAASADGWHSFRVSTFNWEKPDFSRAVKA